jgi:hypothetical protein
MFSLDFVFCENFLADRALAVFVVTKGLLIGTKVDITTFNKKNFIINRLSDLA